jgi:AraC-like DNA-binding protein
MLPDCQPVVKVAVSCQFFQSTSGKSDSFKVPTRVVALSRMGIDSTTVQPDARSRRDTMGRIEAYLRARIDTPTRVSTLSRAVGLSERGLRDAFYAVHGKSPLQWMVAERLERVRRILSQPQSAPINVTGAATKYGFCELGRFAASYRQAFGELPSETLRGAIRTPLGQGTGQRRRL